MKTTLKKIIAHDGTYLAVHEYGNIVKSKSTLLLSHPTGFHGRLFDKTVFNIIDEFNAISFDHRGHGRSIWTPTEPLDWSIFGRDVISILSDYSLDSPLIGIGHSMGATALIMAALESPSRFSALILYEPIIFPLEWKIGMNLIKDSPLAVAARKRRKEFQSFQHAYSNFASKLPMNQFDPDVLRDYVRYGLVETEDIAKSSREDDSPLAHELYENWKLEEKFVKLRCDPIYEASIYNSGHLHNTWNQLSKLTVPTWVIAGKREFFQPSSFAQRIANRIQGANFIRWEDSTHFGPFEKPQRLADLIKQIDNKR